MEWHTSQLGWHRVPHQIWIIFFVHNPLGLVFQNNIFVSCKMMAFFWILDLIGNIMVVCVFFKALGGARPKSRGIIKGSGGECNTDEDLAETMAYKLGRVLAIAMGSNLLAGMPVLFLQSLHTKTFKTLDYVGSPSWKKQLRTWKVKDAMVWVLGLLYLICAMTFICLFLANIAVDDHKDWSTTGALSLMQDAVAAPLAMALAVPVLCNILTLAISKGTRVNQSCPRKSSGSSWINLERINLEKIMLERTAICSGRVSHMTHKMTANVMIFVSRRDTAANLFMNPEVVSFVLNDEDLAYYLVQESIPSGSVDWRTNQSQAEAWARLREQIRSYTLENITKQGHRRLMHYLKTVCMLCFAENPIGALFVLDIFSSCKQRVFIVSTQLLGALAMSCLFFEQGGLQGASC